MQEQILKLYLKDLKLFGKMEWFLDDLLNPVWGSPQNWITWEVEKRYHRFYDDMRSKKTVKTHYYLVRKEGGETTNIFPATETQWDRFYTSAPG